MSEHDPNHEARTSPDGPKPAPSGTGPGGGGGDRPIPADGVAADGGNTPADGSSPGDIDADALDGAAGTAGPTADPRTAEGAAPGGAAAEPAAPETDEAPDAEVEEGEEPATVDAEPAQEEPDWKDRYLRSVAELDNVRKRARRDAAAGEARGIARLAKELLPALDNLDRALAHVDQESDPAQAGGGDQQLVEGVRIVHREIHAALSQAGIEAYDPTGEQFDPFAHEALTQQPAPEGTPPGTILAVYQAGYRRGEDVLRAAKVVVAG